ncbi:MAG: hypothetical protein KDA60_15335 [Planctomycetales bacterium]|nr:hypothetical protein [Planctomycetaceae bacterium]MCA9265233.1 hypothetical protein [Planctomycetales bacterium]
MVPSFPSGVFRAAVLCGVMLTVVAPCEAQSRKPPVGNTRPLDLQAEKVQNEYLQNLAGLASEYEKAGDTEKSAEMLRQILKVRPDVDAVKNKLKEIEESIFDDNTKTMEIDPSKSWTSTGVLVEKDKPVRIEATGTYKFVVNDTLGPNGYQGSTAVQEFSKDLPIGSLIAVVAPANRNPKNKEEPDPTFVGEGKEITFKEGGLLLLRANVPSNAICTGKLKVKISGNYAPAR